MKRNNRYRSSSIDAGSSTLWYHKGFLLVLLGYLVVGCASTKINTEPVRIIRHLNDTVQICVNRQDINTSKALPTKYGKIVLYDDYKALIYSTLLNESDGLLMATSNCKLRLYVKLKCTPPEYRDPNIVAFGTASFFLPFLAAVPDNRQFEYHVSYSVKNASDELLLEKSLTGSVAGHMRGYYIGRIDGLRDLGREQGRFVAENAARLVLDDLSGHSGELIAAAENVEKKSKISKKDTKEDSLTKVNIVTKKNEPSDINSIKYSSSSEEVEIPSTKKFLPMANDISRDVRWAVIIGISDYKDTRIPSIRYASRDAQALYEWIVSNDGGRYAPARVKLLLDHRATVKNIRVALNSWLSKALEEDIVLIYFAGHGSPESPDTSQNLFLLPYDVDFQNISSTAFPMWDIETAIKRFIKAKRIIVVVDACHSGGVGQAFDVASRTGRGIRVNPIVDKLQDLSKVGYGICVISASDNNKVSQESKKWGGGHGVFTYFLLKGLNGEADYIQDGRVTLGELIPYLSEKVRMETKSVQRPTVAGKFDPGLAIGKPKSP